MPGKNNHHLVRHQKNIMNCYFMESKETGGKIDHPKLYVALHIDTSISLVNKSMQVVERGR